MANSLMDFEMADATGRHREGGLAPLAVLHDAGARGKLQAEAVSAATESVEREDAKLRRTQHNQELFLRTYELTSD